MPMMDHNIFLAEERRIARQDLSESRAVAYETCGLCGRPEPIDPTTGTFIRECPRGKKGAA